MKKTIYYFLFLVIPILLAVYLIYRIWATDGLEKSDYVVMVCLFVLNILSAFLRKWFIRSE